MEVSLSRSFMKSTNRQFINTILLSKRHSLKLSTLPSRPLVLPLSKHTLSLSNPNSHPRNHFPNLFSPSSFNSNLNTPISADRFARIFSGHNDKSFEWKFALDDGELGFVDEDKRPVVTVVLLGWLGSKQKHLKRYAEMYNLFGMDAITFAASITDVLGFDLGRNMERRVDALTDEIVSWLEEKEDDGRERFLIFHTFSNTGWLAYGAILDRLQGKKHIVEKIKGCVIDSGGDPELNPKVWAAGFTTALLKKKSSSVVQNGATNYNADEKAPIFMEVFLMAVFEKFFAFLIEFQDVKKRLNKIISTLRENQPYPQLYLYSTVDKVIPIDKIESFLEHQKKLGRQVTTFNFKSSPHVDHFRTFPDKYRFLVQTFLKDCITVKGKQLYNLVK